MDRHLAFQIFKFVGVGGGVALLHLSFVYVLTSVVGVWYLLSSVISYVCATIFNFLLQKFFVWRNTQTETIKTQFLLYATLTSVCLGCNVLLMYVLVSLLGWQYLIAQTLVIMLLSIVTFVVNRTFIF